MSDDICRWLVYNKLTANPKLAENSNTPWYVENKLNIVFIDWQWIRDDFFCKTVEIVAPSVVWDRHSLQVFYIIQPGRRKHSMDSRFTTEWNRLLHHQFAERRCRLQLLRLAEWLRMHNRSGSVCRAPCMYLWIVLPWFARIRWPYLGYGFGAWATRRVLNSGQCRTKY